MDKTFTAYYDTEQFPIYAASIDDAVKQVEELTLQDFYDEAEDEDTEIQVRLSDEDGEEERDIVLTFQSAETQAAYDELVADMDAQ